MDNRSPVAVAAARLFGAAAGWLTLRTVTGELRLAKRTSDFVSNVTHELKSPLTSIQGAAEKSLSRIGGGIVAYHYRNRMFFSQ